MSHQENPAQSREAHAAPGTCPGLAALSKQPKINPQGLHWHCSQHQVSAFNTASVVNNMLSLLSSWATSRDTVEAPGVSNKATAITPGWVAASVPSTVAL